MAGSLDSISDGQSSCDSKACSLAKKLQHGQLDMCHHSFALLQSSAY